jgi:hypothetical protein
MLPQKYPLVQISCQIKHDIVTSSKMRIPLINYRAAYKEF